MTLLSLLRWLAMRDRREVYVEEHEQLDALVTLRLAKRESGTTPRAGATPLGRIVLQHLTHLWTARSNAAGVMSSPAGPVPMPEGHLTALEAAGIVTLGWAGSKIVWFQLTGVGREMVRKLAEDGRR